MALVEIDVSVTRVGAHGLLYAVDGADVTIQNADGSARNVFTSEAGNVIIPQPIKSRNGRIDGWVEGGIPLRYRAVKPGELEANPPWERFYAGGIQGIQGPAGPTGPKGDTGEAVASEAWREIGAAGQPVFENGWVNFHPSFNSAAFYKDAHGLVHLKGMIKAGTIDVAAFTLPAGYRPVLQTLFGVVSNGAIGRVDVGTTGGVLPQAPSSNVWVTLDGLYFRAA